METTTNTHDSVQHNGAQVSGTEADLLSGGHAPLWNMPAAWSLLWKPTKRPWRRRGLFLCFLCLWVLGRWLPLSVARMLGRLLGYAAYGALGRYRRLAAQHLQLAFGPRLSPRPRGYIVRAMFVNLGKTTMEWCVLDRYSPARVRRLVDVQGLPHLHQALAGGRGVIAVSAHFGNWEVLPVALTSMGFHGGVLARPLRYPEYEGFLLGMRARKGVATYARGSVKEVVRVLRANQIIGVMPDQDMDSLEGMFVEFFGRPAYTPIGPAALSLMTGAPLLPCFVTRIGSRFRVAIEEPIVALRTGDRAKDLHAITQGWSRAVEAAIRAHPTEWMWIHRRWKTQPTPADSRQPTADSREASQRLVREPRPVCSCILFTVSCVLCAVVVGCAKSATPTTHHHASTATTKKASPASPATPDAAQTEPPVSQQLDSFTMEGFAQDGTKRWTLNGRGAHLEGAIVTIQRPDAIGYDPERTAYLTASLAQVHQESRRIRMEHEVTIHTSDGLWLSSPLLYWLPDREEIVTDQPVRLEGAHLLARGYGASGHSRLNVASLLRDVEVVFNPRSGTQFSVPGASGKEQESKERSHVMITCDGPLTFDYEHNIATFEGNVHVRDAQGDIFSDKLVAYLDQTEHTITYAEATGQVRIVQGPHTATGQRAVYEPLKTKVTLLGAPSLLLYPDEKGQPTAMSVGGLAAAPGPTAHMSGPPTEPTDAGASQEPHAP